MGSSSWGFGNILLPYMYRDLGLTFPRILRRKHSERMKDQLFVACILLAGGNELFGGGRILPHSSWESASFKGCGPNGRMEGSLSEQYRKS